MKHWVLRFEAGDFDNTVFDVQQLSAIRGASLTFLNSSDLVEKIMTDRLGEGFSKIYSGASQGVYSFTASEDDARKVLRAVDTALARPDPGETGCHQHMSYATALVPGTGREALLRSEAICAAKTRQDSRPPLPRFEPGQVRPGERRDPRPAMAGKAVSATIADRLDYGRTQRQGFYARRLAGGTSRDSVPFDFTDDFEEITAFGDRLDGTGALSDRGDLPVSLHNKMAVFFTDGNRLGKHREAAIAADATLARLGEFSADLLELQRGLLSVIVDWLAARFEDGTRVC